jgi:virginiamycin A acetyltransferase
VTYAERYPGCEISEEAVIEETARIYGSVRGTRVVIGAGTRIYDYVVIRSAGGTGDVVVGRNCHIGPHAVFYSGNGIHIGDDSLVGAHVLIVPAHHITAQRDIPVRVQGFKPSRGGVVIEDDGLIGVGSILLDGTHVERGAFIAAGSVVSGRIPAYSVWAGVPARMIKERRED